MIRMRNLARKLSFYFTILFLIYVALLCVIARNSLNKNANNCNEGNIKDKQLINNNEVKAAHEVDLYKNAYISTVVQEFDFNEDTLALIHIQKTSGSAWEKHILDHMKIQRATNVWEHACTYNMKQKRNTCSHTRYRKSFFWDRYMSPHCDIHADYSELKNCIMHEYRNRIQSQYLLPVYQGIVHFMTFLRDPVQRYISEYEHVKKGATWTKSVRTCRDQELYKKKCYNGDSWANVSWVNFLNCENNLANNRQVRMLANHNILGCNALKCLVESTNCSSELKLLNQQKLLESAKHTLVGLAFFGLTEHQELSEYLFLKTFNENKFQFTQPIKDINETIAKKSLDGEASKYIERIKEKNNLDIELYNFAKELFFKRVNYFKKLDEDKQLKLTKS